MEPFLFLMFVLPANSPAKWFFLLSAAAFHIGIIGTLKIPFANVAMLGAIPIALTPELMHGVLGQPLLEGGSASAKTHMSGFFGNPMCVLLWLVGIAQSYRLFDWIDARNYHVRYEVFALSAHDSSERRTVDPGSLFPQSIRHLLLQSYLLGNVWLQLDAEQLAELRESILHRHAQRYARRNPDAGPIEVVVVSQRVTADNLSLSRGERRLLMRFECHDGTAVMDSTALGV
jgi:hypothetical protein